FRYFSEDKFKRRGCFDENLKYFINDCPKSKQWDLEKDSIKEKGVSSKELYLILLNAYREKHHPDKSFVGELSPFLEQHFPTLIDWFGNENVRMIQITRNPFLNFASYKKKHIDRGDFYLEKLLYNFCYTWPRSIAYGQFLQKTFPQSFKTIHLDDYFNNHTQIIHDLINWLDIPPKDIILQEKPTTPTMDSNESDSLMRLLSTKEKNIISEMSCHNFLDCSYYSNNKLLLDFKDNAFRSHKRNLLSKSLRLTRMGLLIDKHPALEILKTCLLFHKQILSALGHKIISSIKNSLNL
ncbi:hypothetical protein ACFLS1_12675, partial [Verrucomicrobiota bacterium]